MSGTILLAGILEFASKELLEQAFEALRTEETYSPESSLVPVYQEAMVTDTIMVLRHASHLSPRFYDRVMAEAYLLTEFAGKGYIAGILRDKQPRVQVAMAAMSYPVVDAFETAPDPETAQDYLPRLRNTRMEYVYQSEGRDALVEWNVSNTRFGRLEYISFPHDGSTDPFNDWWDGHYYLKSGSKWYSIATDLDAKALSDPAEEEIQLILDGNGKPGDIHLAYVPGTESFRLYIHEGFEDIETPFGNFDRAMKVRVDLYFLPTDESKYAEDPNDRIFKKVTTTHYFGKGAGLVKLVFEGGELALASMHEQEEPASATQVTASPAPPQPAAQNENPSNADGSRKPWWKFW